MAGTLGADNSTQNHKARQINKVYTRKNKKAPTAKLPQGSVQTLAAENVKSLPQLDSAKDDSSRRVDVPNGNGAVEPIVTRVNDRVKINLGPSRSKDEIRELRGKIVRELDQVRTFVKKVEDKEAQLIAQDVQVTPPPPPPPPAANPFAHAIERRGLARSNSELHADNNASDRRALLRVNSEVGSVGPQDMRPFRHLSVSVMDNNYGHGEYIEKEKRTPKANQFYRNSEFLLGKDRLPPESNKKLKSNGARKHGGEMNYGFGNSKYRNQVFRSCNSLLQRLMKHKHGWVFNEPVNAKALGLHDYHDIIKNPMDLGSVKTRLAQNFYKSPTQFADDVRRTFHNAMTYNPKGQDVHIMAETLLNIFEERWAVIEAEYIRDLRYEMISDAGLPTPTSKRAHQPSLTLPQRTLDRPESITATVDSRFKPSNFMPASRTPVPKKPKAKDPNKRDMTFEEKQRLSTNLQSLPSEKLDNLIQIIKKRNLALNQHDDEIEVDIDSVDTETLWELDRFVTNYKKSLSKNKRKAEIALQARAGGGGHAAPVMNKAPPAILDSPKENGNGTVERNIATSSPGQGEKQGDNASRSSSSCSSSSDSGSSSSDSDSDSSSADGSDAGHSPRT